MRFLRPMLLTLLLFLSFNSAPEASILLPGLDIDTLPGDMGIVNVGGTLSMDATVTGITTDTGFISLPPENFALTATLRSYQSPVYTFETGSLTAASHLTATFDTLILYDLGGGTGAFYADLIYTGGTLKGSFTGGRIEGGFFQGVLPGPGGDFTADTFIAKAGATLVPVPSALCLFASGIVGLSVFKRRFVGRA